MRLSISRLMDRWRRTEAYADLFDVMRYPAPEAMPAGTFPDIHGFRVKDARRSPDPRPSFAFLETADEVIAWHRVMAGAVERDANGQITDLPLLRWNDIPSLLTSDVGMMVTCLPEETESDWPSLAVYTHPFDSKRIGAPARDRYGFEQNKFIAIL